ncbi:hypothetical protein F511_36375 [Dorcoceras hygrometricum]|uniref:Triacylglycerol lipase n=1 Tax=Dorcoceras hygrometricum TaxID=472368 RepID=A0A2Z7A4M3_9LAMI|nr:hypothetical protein F511_36375 [Dorcoceras hygrometricum]
MLPTTNQTQQSSRNYPVATIQSQAIQSQAIQSQAIPKAGRFLTTGTRRNPRNAAFQLNQTTSRCFLDWFLNSPSWSPSRNTISSRDWFFNSSTGHSLTSATTARRNSSATTDFPIPPAASYSNHQIPNPTSRWLHTCVTLNGSGIQLAVGPQPLRLRNHNFGLAQRIMAKRLATSRHDPLGITDSACKNQLVVVSVQYGPFNTYIPIRSTTIGKSRVARDPIAMHASWRSNSDIASVTRVSMTFRVVRTNQYNQNLGLIHSTNGNHLESPNEGSSIDHQVTIHLHAQNIIMFPTNETWYFTSQMLVSSSSGLILILTAQSTRNVFRMHSDY